MMKVPILSALSIPVLVAIAPMATAASWLTVPAPFGDRFDDVSGEIKSVDMDRKSLVIRTVDGEVTISFTDKTVYTLDGKESTREAAIKAGHKAIVKHDARIATRIDATSTPK